jgi:fatty-acyl-CoA synthase
MGVSVASRRHSTVQTASFTPTNGARVFNEAGKDVIPGSGEIGMIATNTLVPLCYYKDDVKSAATFREVDGDRYSFPGDYATVEADGTITLLGRGSLCINTAGEKVFPEEVEEAVKKHDAISDCLVVGIPDQRYGERVVAVASVCAGRQAEAPEIIDFTKAHLAGYKAPRHVLFMPEVPRAPNGKPDHKSAREYALETLSPSEGAAR